MDGKPVAPEGRTIRLPAEARKLEIGWKRVKTPDLSYRTGVELYVDKYWKIQRGEPIENFDCRWIFPE